MNQQINLVLEEVNRIVGYANAYSVINERSNDAYEYCRKYSTIDNLGHNIWHIILDDAIKMRKELEVKNG